ncbi:phage tail tape measure protein [Nonomuraea sp. NPDC003560]|uniref:phage tail tape measure protein n=1 Tax=Nonomuraea sp. NPDC003560 TaxID=3364341 RepID=UPI00369E2600
MALTVGELVAYAQLDRKDFQRGTKDIASDMRSLQSSTTSSMQSMESTMARSLKEIEQAIADGLDPASAIADLDRLEAALNASLADMDAEADRFAAELDAAIEEAFADLDDVARRGGQDAVDGLRAGLDGADDVAEQAGKDAGEKLADGLEDGLKDAPRKAREHGRKSGKEFGDGVEDGGGGKGGGGRMAGIGSNLLGGLKAGAIGLAAGAGAAIGDKLIEGIQTALERADLFATLAVKVGAFGKESERLGRLAGEIYADAYGESLEQVTDALARVLQNVDGAGKLGDSALKDMTSQALVTGKVMDEDVGAVIRAVSQMLRTGLAKNAEQAFNVLIRGQQEGVNKSEDLLDSFNEYSTIFRDFGIDASEALGLMSQGLKSGARDSDVVADSLKELNAKIRDKSAAKALKELGLNADQVMKAIAKGGPEGHKALDLILTKFRDIKDPAEKAQIAAGLFGTKAEDMAKAINGINLDTAKKSVGDFKGAVDTASKTLGDTSSADADRWARGWEDTLSTVGGAALEVIKANFPSPADWDDSWAEVSGWFSGTVGPFFGDLWTSVSDTTAEIWDGIGSWLSTKASEIADWVGETPGKIKEFFVSGWNDLKANTSEAWENIKSGISEKANAIVSWLQSVPGKVRDFFVSGWNDLKAQTSTSWEGIKSSATKKADELVAWLKGLPAKIKALFAAAGSWLLQAGKDLVQGLINGVQSKIQDAANTVTGLGRSLIDAAKRAIDSHSPSKEFEKIGKWTVEGLILGITKEEGNVKSTIEKMVEMVKAAFKSKPDVADHLLDFIKMGNKNLEDLALQREALVKRLAEAKEYAKKVAGDAKEWASITGLKTEDIAGAGDLANELKSKAHAINDFANNIKELARRGLNKATIQQIIDAGVEKGSTWAEMLVGSDGSEIKALNKAQAAVDKASKKLGKASADAMYDTGKQAGAGYLKGLQESLKALDKEMKKIVDALVKAIKKELKIKSPSQVMADIGQQTIDGLAVGMSDAASSAVAAMQDVANQVISKAAGSLGAFGMVGGSQPGAAPMAMVNGKVGATAGTGLQGYTPQPAQPGGGGVVVQVDMSGSTIQEKADIPELATEMGYKVLATI